MSSSRPMTLAADAARAPAGTTRGDMAKLKSIDAQHFRIPLDVPASDSTHGVMTSFELITARVTDADGQEGVGYTYTTGHNGGGDPSPAGARDSRGRRRRRLRADRGGLAEGLVGAALRRPRRAVGAGAVGARHGAVGPQGAAREPAALSPAGRQRPEGAVLRRRHRPRPVGQGPAGARPTATSRRASAPSRPRSGATCCTRTSSASAPCASTWATASR